MLVKSDQRPLYLLVKDKLLELINNGYYKKGSKLPSEFDLAKTLGVSRPTLREALRVLEEENILIRRHGIGTFVNDKTTTIKSGIEELHSVTESIEQLNMSAGTKLLSVSIINADDRDKQKLDLLDNYPLIKIERVRTANLEPVVYCIDKLVKTDKFQEKSFNHIDRSIFNFLETNYNLEISYAISEIVPVIANYKLAKALNLPARTPILLLDQVHLTSENKPILYSKNYFRSDRFSFHVIRKRQKL